MKECLSSLRRMMGLNTTANTDTKDQKLIQILSDINKNISQLTEKNTLLNGRIVALEDDKTQSKNRILALEDDKTQSKNRILALEDDKTQSKDRILALEDDKTQSKDRILALEDDKTQSKDRIIVLEDRIILLEDRIIVLEDENVLYKDQLNVVEDNVKMLNDICLEPIIRNVAVQIMYHFFTNKIFSPSGRFTKASSRIGNNNILNIVTSQLNCNPADIDALINARNKDSHLNIIDLNEKVDYVRIIISNSPKFSDDLRLPLDIIANYESFVIHFGKLK